jgi:hypothetical protein
MASRGTSFIRWFRPQVQARRLFSSTDVLKKAPVQMTIASKSLRDAFKEKSTASLLKEAALLTLISSKVTYALGQKMLAAAAQPGLSGQIAKTLAEPVISHFWCVTEDPKTALKHAEAKGYASQDVVLDPGVEMSKTATEVQQAFHFWNETLEGVSLQSGAKETPSHAPTIAIKLSAIYTDAMFEKPQEHRNEIEASTAQFIAFLKKAQTNKIPVIVDAEDLLRQPFIDKVTQRLIKEGFSETLIPTVQCYRTGAAKDVHDYIAGGATSLKLVRGAYMRHDSQKDPTYLWTEKEQTDACYNTQVEFAMKQNPPLDTLKVCTHNIGSIECALSASNPPQNTAVVQLLGMDFARTLFGPHRAIRYQVYAPFGPLEVAIPYSQRRGEELAKSPTEPVRLTLIKLELRRRAEGAL